MFVIFPLFFITTVPTMTILNKIGQNGSAASPSNLKISLMLLGIIPIFMISISGMALVIAQGNAFKSLRRSLVLVFRRFKIIFIACLPLMLMIAFMMLNKDESARPLHERGWDITNILITVFYIPSLVWYVLGFLYLVYIMMVKGDVQFRERPGIIGRLKLDYIVPSIILLGYFAMFGWMILSSEKMWNFAEGVLATKDEKVSVQKDR